MRAGAYGSYRVCGPVWLWGLDLPTPLVLRHFGLRPCLGGSAGHGTIASIAAVIVTVTVIVTAIVIVTATVTVIATAIAAVEDALLPARPAYAGAHANDPQFMPISSTRIGCALARGPGQWRGANTRANDAPALCANVRQIHIKRKPNGEARRRR